MLTNQNNVPTMHPTGVRFTMTDNQGNLCINNIEYQNSKEERDELKKLNNEKEEEFLSLKNEISKLKK